MPEDGEGDDSESGDERRRDDLTADRFQRASKARTMSLVMSI